MADIDALLLAEAEKGQNSPAKLINSKLPIKIPENIINKGLETAGLSDISEKDIEDLIQIIRKIINPNPFSKLDAVNILRRNPKLLKFLKAIPALRIPVEIAQRIFKSPILFLLMGLNMLLCCAIPCIVIFMILGVGKKIVDDPVAAAQFIIETGGELAADEGCQAIAEEFGEEGGDQVVNFGIDALENQLIPGKELIEALAGEEVIPELNIELNEFYVNNEDVLNCSTIVLMNYENFVARTSE